MNRTVAVAGLDRLPNLAVIDVRGFANLRSIDEWPGFANLRDNIVFRREGSNDVTVGEVRRARTQAEAARIAAKQRAAEEKQQEKQQEEQRRLAEFEVIRHAIVDIPHGDAPNVLLDAIKKHNDCVSLSSTQFGTLLHVAARVGAVETARVLVRAFPQLASVFDEEGCLPVHLAARGNHVAMLDVLAGSVALMSRAQRTPLHDAAQHDCVEFATALLARKVTIDAIDEDGRTPLILAAQNSAERTCVLLAERGANLHVKARDGKSAMDVLRLINRGLATNLEAIERKAGREQLVATARAQWLAQHGGLTFAAAATLRNAETVERIRCGKFDLLSDPLVKNASKEPHGRTLLALGLAAHAAVTFDDLNELLVEQEALGTEQSSLFLLAHARMVAFAESTSKLATTSPAASNTMILTVLDICNKFQILIRSK
jgi:ankyrin repeat protein